VAPPTTLPSIGPAQNPTADFNGDHTVNILDLSVTAANYETAAIIDWPIAP
jgi:hypothetical protein